MLIIIIVITFVRGIIFTRLFAIKMLMLVRKLSRRLN